MRVLAIDFGEARIGLAIAVGATSDNTAQPFAVPLETLERTTDRIAIAQLAGLISERRIETLVVGLPLACPVNITRPASESSALPRSWPGEASCRSISSTNP